MIRTIIIDDEKNNIDVLGNLLTQYSQEIKVEATAEDAEQAYEVIMRIKPQLIFLDIELPLGNAFTLLEKLVPVNFEIIFVTAFDQYAIDAFKYGAMDYILKPISIEHLNRAVTRAITRIGQKDINERLVPLLNYINSSDSGKKRIALPTADGLLFEDASSIIRLEAKGAYTLVYFNHRDKELVTRSLKEFEDMLAPLDFFRLHHSHIVNLKYIKKYFKGRGGYVELMNGVVIEVSSRKREKFLQIFK